MKNFISIPFMSGVIINGPLLLLNIIINIFYAFCLIFPHHIGQRKHPLTVLLGFLIFSILSYCAFVITVGMYTISKVYVPYFGLIISLIISITTDYCTLSYVWLNFYYYIQIVPAQCALFHWVKRNIKCIIFVVLVVDVLQIAIWKSIVYIKYIMIINNPGFSFNNTINSFELIRKYSFIQNMMHYSVMLLITLMSSFLTVCYLHKHMKNMGKSGTSFPATRLRSQMRVTITGICQGVLFFLHGSYLLFNNFTLEFSKDFLVDGIIMTTVTTLFISGTTVTLGIGQNAFRQRIVDMYQALKRVNTCQKTK